MVVTSKLSLGAVILACLVPASVQSGQLGVSPDIPPALRSAVQAALQADEYAIVLEQDAAPAALRWTAVNSSQRLQATFSQRAVSIDVLAEPAVPSNLTLQLVAWGRTGAVQPPEPAELVVEDARIEYRRGPLVEWYVNEPRGLEQGFTIAAPPSVGDPSARIELQLVFSGQLSPELSRDGHGLVLLDGEGVARLSYGQLAAWDADGQPLSSCMELSGAVLSILVETSGVHWPLTVDPLIASEQAKLTASDAGATDLFGRSVASSGETAVVGAYFGDQPGANNSGVAYAFVRSGTAWSEQAILVASDTATGDFFGISAALSGETAIVGAHRDDHLGGVDAGSAYVFVRNGTVWTEQAKLTASDAAAGDTFGFSVALSGNTAVVGAPLDDHAGGVDAGSAYVFVRNGTVWTEQAQLKVSDTAAGDEFGVSVEVSGDTAVVGAWRDDHSGGTDAGSAYVFVRSGTVWTEQAKLTASDAAASDAFGIDVTVSGDTAVVGAHLDDHAGGINAGSAYVFVRSGTSWSEQAQLLASDAATNDQFGVTLAFSGRTALVGALTDDHAGGINAGSAYVFVRSGTVWSEQDQLTASDAAANDRFGGSVALSGDTAIAGATFNDHAGGTDAGAAYVFDITDITPDPWTDQGSALAGVFGDPLLVGTGTLAEESSNSVNLSNTATNALAALFLALSSTPVPFKGGTLLPFPFLPPVFLNTNASGTISIPFQMPVGIPASTELWVQWGIQDGAAVTGVALSNAIKGVTP